MSYPAYAEVKASGVEWLGDVPKDWAIRRMRYACHLNPTKSEVSSLPPETLVSFLPMEKVGTEGELVLDDNRALEDVLQGFTYFRNIDIITAKITPCFENGKGAIVSHLTNGIGFGSTEFHVLRPFRGNVPRFIYYLTKSHSFRSWGIASMYGAGGQKRVPEDFIEDFRIGFPPEAQQQQIAAFLDRKTAELDAVLRLKKRQLELLAEKRQALISQAVTRGLDPSAPLKPSGIAWLGDVPEHWEIVPLKYLASFTGGGTPAKENLDFWAGEIPWVSPKDMKTDWIEDTEDHISEDALTTNATSMITPGTVLLVVRSGILKHTIPVAINIKPVTLNQDMKAVIFGRRAEARYFAYLVRGCQNTLLTLWRKAGATVESIEQEYLANTECPVPPIPEQAAIVAYIDRETAQMDGIAQAIRAQIGTVREYRQALISAAVTGKIDVRAEAGNPA